MTALYLKLTPQVYRRLREEAAHLGKSPQVVAQEWIVERPTPSPAAVSSDRERARQALRAAGLLTELGPNLRRFADPTARLEEIRVALDRTGGKALSEIILEQRGPKER
jgi:aryl-alcohol dehydrogenase-like predicted oxidoreductase